MALVNALSLQLAADRVAVALTHGNYGAHIGIVFHTAKEGPKLVHLAWHRDLRIDEFPPEHCWIACEVDIPAKASAQLVACLRGLSKKRPHIGYGFNFIAGEGAFAPNGSYKPPKGADGFTCSTFVAELFRTGQLPLIDIATWNVPEAANVEWAEKVCANLKDTADADHIAAMRRNINGLRVRPDEVAAAADLPFKQRPANYQTALAGRDAVMKALYEICPKPQLKQAEMAAAVAEAPASGDVSSAKAAPPLQASDASQDGSGI